MKKNICFFLGDLSGVGGTERMTCNLANKLADLGYDILVIGIKKNQKVFFNFDKRITVIPLFENRQRVFWLFPLIIYRLSKFIIQYRIDVLINVDVILALFSLPLKCVKRSLRIVSWEHFNFVTDLGIKSRNYSRILSKLYADAIVTLTEEDKRYYEKDGKVHGKILAIPNFIEDIPSLTSICEEPVVLAVGRFCYQKGFNDLIDVWNWVKKDSVSNGWKLRIVGDGEDKDCIIQKIKDYNLEQSVEILPATKNISYYYLHSSILAMTSHFEGLPMVLIESKFYGLPVVCLNCKTGPEDLIVENENGFIIQNRDLEKMAGKICCLIKDVKLRKQMGEEALMDSSRFKASCIIPYWLHLFEIL